MFDAIRDNGVTHMCGAPIVYSMLINAPADLRAGIGHRIQGQIAGAAPPAAIIEGAEHIGIEITHVYGLTEVYGPAGVCSKQESWSFMPIDRRAERNGRQGVRTPLQEAMTVLDPETMQPVPWDGETMGEIMFRGNITMKGYLKNPHATEQAFAGGWFHTGDLAVTQPDGYVKIRDPVSPPGRAQRRRCRATRREMGRDAVRLHRAEIRCLCHRRGTPRFLPRAYGSVQGPEDVCVPGDSEDLHGEDTEVCVASACQIRGGA